MRERCSCQPNAVCDECYAFDWSHLAGVAAARGSRWAEQVAVRAHRADRDAPWPETPRMLGIATTKVEGLATDPRLVAAFADACAREAARRWEMLRAVLRTRR